MRVMQGWGYPRFLDKDGYMHPICRNIIHQLSDAGATSRETAIRFANIKGPFLIEFPGKYKWAAIHALSMTDLFEIRNPSWGAISPDAKINLRADNIFVKHELKSTNNGTVSHSGADKDEAGR